MFDLRRREFITLFGGAVALPLAAGAQQQPKMLRVGFVGMQPRETPHYANFLKRMAELGYQEGRNFTFDSLACLRKCQSRFGGSTPSTSAETTQSFCSSIRNMPGRYSAASLVACCNS